MKHQRPTVASLTKQVEMLYKRSATNSRVGLIDGRVREQAKELSILRENAALRDRKHDELKSEQRSVEHVIEQRTGMQRVAFENIAALQRRLTSLEGQQQRDRDTLNEARDYMKALGPLWKTQAGHFVPIMLLSTNHLERLLSGGWANKLSTTIAIKGELDRRRIDAQWRAKDDREVVKDLCLEELRRKVCDLDTRVNELEYEDALDADPNVDPREDNEGYLTIYRDGCSQVLASLKFDKPAFDGLKVDPPPKRKSRIAAAWRAFWKGQSDLGCAG